MSVARRVAGPLLSVLAFLATFELTVRAVDPRPRVQAITPELLDPPGPDGVLTWHAERSRERLEGRCAPDDRGVLVVGSSILYGSELPARDVVSAHLAPLLADTPAAGCVRNVAQPGFAGEQKLAVARPAIEAHRPLVVLWEVWTNDPGHYVLLGERAYNVGALRVDARGVPAAFAFPAGPHRWLFEHARAWRYLHLTLAGPDRERVEAGWHGYLDRTLPEARRLVEAHGGELLVVVMPPMDRPFDATLRENLAPDSPYAGLLRGEGGFHVLDGAAIFRGRDPVEVAIDACCHLSPAGHAALAEALAPRIEALLPDG